MFNVVSLFDGISCGQQSLKKIGVPVDFYFASEIDKAAIEITKKNHPQTIQLGDVRRINFNDLPKIDLLIGGSPCQSFSFAGKMNGMTTNCSVEITSLEQYLKLKISGFEFKGQSYLFWEFVRALSVLKPKFFLLENVRMVQKWENIITNTLGVQPLRINSKIVSAQNRKRLYWTNISRTNYDFTHDVAGLAIKDVLSDPEFDFNLTMDQKDIKSKIKGHFHDLSLIDELDYTDASVLKFFLFKKGTSAFKQSIKQLKSIDDKANCLTTSGQKFANSGSTNVFYYRKNGKLTIRPLNELECERLQCLPDFYTSGVPKTRRFHALGNGWTVGVISIILHGLKNHV